MKALNKFILPILFFLAIINLAFGQAELNSELGIPADSEEYNSYSSCISGCSSCEIRCKDSSLQQYAENKQDLSLCNQLSNEELKNLCNDNINSAIAISSKDKNKCNTINDEDLKSSCMSIIVQHQAIDSGKPDACNTLPDNLKESCANRFYLELARKNNDESMCKKLPEPQRAECILAIKMPEEADKKPINLTILFWVIGSVILMLGIFASAYFLIKRKKTLQEAPLLFAQQKQPSQLAPEIIKNPQAQSANNIDINRLQEALKKVGK